MTFSSGFCMVLCRIIGKRIEGAEGKSLTEIEKVPFHFRRLLFVMTCNVPTFASSKEKNNVPDF